MSQHDTNIPSNGVSDTERHVDGIEQHAKGSVDDMPKPVRVTVEEAAKVLGTSENAVRKRIERGTIRSEKVEGVRYILLSDNDMSRHAQRRNGSAGDMPNDSAAPSQDSVTGMPSVVANLEDQVDYLRHQLEVWQEEARRKDHIIAALAERIPAIEPPREGAPDTPEQPVRDAYEQANGTAQSDEGEVHRASWWRRWFLGE